MEKTKILLLCIDSDTTRILYHYLQQQHDVVAVVMEKKIHPWQILQRRFKKLGIWQVTGQLLFMLLVVQTLRLFSCRRVRSILRQYELKANAIDDRKIIKTKSVNQKETVNFILRHSPDVVVVHGTRIISGEILECLPGKFINLHAGITPHYRGVHGMYWALALNDEANAGVTIHLVDAGIDTGKILAQKKISPSERDNFFTYPYLQLAVGLPLLSQCISEFQSVKNTDGERREKGVLRYHPTLWQYFRLLISRGVK